MERNEDRLLEFNQDRNFSPIHSVIFILQYLIDLYTNGFLITVRKQLERCT